MAKAMKAMKVANKAKEAICMKALKATMKNAAKKGMKVDTRKKKECRPGPKRQSYPISVVKKKAAMKSPKVMKQKAYDDMMKAVSEEKAMWAWIDEQIYLMGEDYCTLCDFDKGMTIQHFAEVWADLKGAWRRQTKMKVIDDDDEEEGSQPRTPSPKATAHAHTYTLTPTPPHRSEEHHEGVAEAMNTMKVMKKKAP